MGGDGVWRGGKREIIYLSLQCHHQNDFCINMGSDESHFNVSLIVRDKITRQCLQTTTFFFSFFFFFFFFYGWLSLQG